MPGPSCRCRAVSWWRSARISASLSRLLVGSSRSSANTFFGKGAGPLVGLAAIEQSHLPGIELDYPLVDAGFSERVARARRLGHGAILRRV